MSMLFRTEEERKAFLLKLAKNETSLQPGDSVRHIVSIKGLRLNTGLIKRDFAILLFHEINARRPMVCLTQEKIFETKAFNEAFCIARKPADADVHNTIISLGSYRGSPSSNMDPIDGNLTDEEINKLRDVCDDIYHELLGNTYNKLRKAGR